MPKVSVIIPVYNAERYLREAIESVLKQTYTDFELLLINDRSTDNSMEICREYSKKDHRIVLLENNSEDHGPGSTRNIGLDHATGEYIYFMDADDWIDERLLECAVKRIQETKADIVKFGAVFEKGDRVHSQPYCWNGKDIMTKDEIKKNILNFWKENMNTLWVHLFRRETIKEIRFENMINGEDISYVVDALCYAEKIAYIKEAFYHYRYVEGSTSHHWSKNAVQCRGIIWNHQRKLLESFQNSMDPLVYASTMKIN